MPLDWLLNPVTFYSVGAVCLLTGLALFVRVKIEIARMRSLAKAPQIASQPDERAVSGLKVEVEQLRESVCRLEETMPVRGSGAGLNDNKRAVALRMHRRGEAISSISAALETPSNEIALLLKMHTLMETKAS
jgi:hypothetical protein